MASKGSFNTTGYQGRYLVFEWSIKSQSAASNSSVISWSLKGAGGAAGYYYTQNIKVTINGATVYSKPRIDGQVVLYNGTVVATGTCTLAHNADGSCSFKAYAEAGIYEWAVNCTGSGDFELDPIYRASDPTLSASSVSFGNKVVITTNRKSSSFSHSLYCSISGNADVLIAEGVGSSYTWTVPYELMEKIPNSKSAKITLRLRTFSGGTNIGDNTVEFNATVPENSATKPSITINDVSPVGSPDGFTSLFIQGKSKVCVKFGAAGKHGASIKTSTISVDGKTYGASKQYTSDYLIGYGEKTITITATDSRGISTSVKRVINVIAYTAPKAIVSVCARCTADGTLSDAGTYLKISAKRSYSKITSGDKQLNSCLIRYRYKLSTGSDYSEWTTILGKTASSNQVTTDALLAGALDIQSTYLVQIQAVDEIEESPSTTTTIPTERVYWHRDGEKNSFTFGGYVEEENTFAIAEGITFKVQGEKWSSLGLSSASGVSNTSSTYGRAPSGCRYRVVNGNHVYIEFNCSFTFSGSYVRINSSLLPTKYRPARNVYAFCATEGRIIIRAYVTPGGEIYVAWAQNVASSTSTTSVDVPWVDGHIDFFLP